MGVRALISLPRGQAIAQTLADSPGKVLAPIIGGGDSVKQLLKRWAWRSK